MGHIILNGRILCTEHVIYRRLYAFYDFCLRALLLAKDVDIFAKLKIYILSKLVANYTTIKCMRWIWTVFFFVEAFASNSNFALVNINFEMCCWVSRMSSQSAWLNGVTPSLIRHLQNTLYKAYISHERWKILKTKSFWCEILFIVFAKRYTKNTLYGYRTQM